MRVALIGAGPCGLSFLRELLPKPQLNVTCFERGNNVGGLWNYTSEIGISKEDGLPIHTPMYENLTLNVPRFLAEVPGFHPPAETPSFPHRSVYLNYWRDFASTHNLLNNVQTRHLVESVVPKGSSFEVTVRDTRQGGQSRVEEEFDAVVACNGHYTAPVTAQLPGIETFPGRKLHVHEYRKPDEFAGQRVLLVGTSLSGDDLNFQLQDHAKKVVACYRRKSMMFHYELPKTVQHPEVTRVEGSTVHFSDNCSEEIDTVIFCTGYRFDFPFLQGQMLPQFNSRFRFPLWRHMVHLHHPRLLFPGLHYRMTAPGFASQAIWGAAYLNKEIKCPTSVEARRQQVEELHSKWPKPDNETNIFHEVKFEFDYLNSLLKEAGARPLHQVYFELWDKLIQDALKNRLLCRQVQYRVDNDLKLTRTYPPGWTTDETT